MIIIKNYGIESEAVNEISRKNTVALAAALNVAESDILFLTERGYLIQSGEDQTDFLAYVQFEHSTDLKIDENDAAKILQKIYSEFVVHLVIRFSSYHDHDEIRYFNGEYPLYLTAENSVESSHFHSEDEVDFVTQDNSNIYEGDIFADLSEEDLDE